MLKHIVDILIFGGLVLSSLLMFAHPLKVNVRANRWQGVFLLLWASYWLEEVLALAGAPGVNLQETFVGNIIQFFTPMAFYIMFRIYINPKGRLRRAHWPHAILPTINLIVLAFDRYTYANFRTILIILVLISGLMYVFLVWIGIRRHRKNLESYCSNTEGDDLSWLSYMTTITLFIVLLVAVFNVFYFDVPLDLLISCLMLGSIYLFIYFSLRQKELTVPQFTDSPDILTDNEQSDRSGKALLSEEQLVKLQVKLEDVMAEKQPHLDGNISLMLLAQQLDLSPHQLSYLINRVYQKNFFQFINVYRVEHAKCLLSNQENDHLSMLGIAFESGFRSKTAFNTAFKKNSGQTPSDYKKQRSDL